MATKKTRREFTAGFRHEAVVLLRASEMPWSRRLPTSNATATWAESTKCSAGSNPLAARFLWIPAVLAMSGCIAGHVSTRDQVRGILVAGFGDVDLVA
jgi:hypothetical protein